MKIFYLLALVLLAFILLCSSPLATAQQAKLDSLIRLNARYLKSDEHKLELLNELTKVYGFMQLDSMKVYVDKSLALAKQLGSKKGLGNALNNQGYYLLINEKTKESKEVYHESIAINSACNNKKGLGWAYLGIATLYKSIDDIETYKSYTEKALRVFSEINDIHGISNVYLWLGTYYLKGNDSSKVKFYHRKALAGFKSIGDEDNYAFTLQYLALTFGKSFLYDSAMAYRQESLALAKKSHHRGNLISIYADLGGQYVISANYPKAIDHMLQGLRYSEEMSDYVSARYLLSNITSMYCDLGDYDKALVYTKKQLTYAQKNDNKFALRGCYVDFAEVYINKKKYKEALSQLNEVQKIDREIGDSIYAYAVYFLSGAAYEGLGQYDSAYVFYYKALDDHKKVENSSGYPKYFIAIARAIKKIPIAQIKGILTKTISPTNKYNQAIGYTNEALTLAQKAGMLGMQRDALQLLSELYEIQNNVLQSFHYYKQFTTLKDSVMNTENVKSVANLQIQYETEKKEQQITLLNKDNELQTKELDKQKFVRNGFIAGFGVMILFAGLFLFQRNKISKEKTRSDGLLLNILPAEVAEELKSKGTADAKHFDNVTVLFTDFKSFTKVSEQLSPQELVDELHTCFKSFDDICGKYSIEKIKTIGDAYLAVCGLPLSDEKHAENVVQAALEIREFMKKRRENLGAKTFEIRIGINSGSVVAGIVGVKKFAYDIWGDTVNTAARMEQNSEAGKINISETTYALVKDQFTCEYRGEIDAKNKGKLAMYFVETANNEIEKQQ